MDYNEVYNEFQKVLQELANITGKSVDEIKQELEDTDNLEELLKRAAEVFDNE